MNDMYEPIDFGGQETMSVGKYAAKTFGWMALGLLTTFIVMIASFVSGLSWMVLSSSAYLVLTIAEVVVVLVLSARINKLSVGAARGLYFAYAVLNGVVFGAYFIMFQAWSLVLVFAMTALYFGVMAAVGYFTKVDLSGLRPVLFGGVLLLLAFWIITWITGFSGFDQIACIVGTAIFLAFTAYDTQKIKRYHEAYSAHPEMLHKAAIFSALQLYLDFINLFLYLLRLLGRRR